MTDLLAGKNIVVTGASNGIGRGIALRAAAHGAKAIWLSDLSEAPRADAPTTTELVRRAGAEAHFIKADVASKADVDALVAATAAAGGVDVMVANAGTSLPGDDADVSPQTFQTLLRVNLEGVLYSIQAAARQMESLGKGGSIVLTSSMAAVHGSRLSIGYGASKGGVSQLAKGMADALGPKGIRVNAVCPGFIATELLKASPGAWDAAQKAADKIPLRRMGEPADVGDVVAWLGSDYAAYVNGVELLVDGGLASVVVF